jgi:two-component system, chemotaxis family, sensor kinase CheA
LQDLSMSMRMVPVQGVFQKMARLVRDLSRKAGKEIELNISGAETELDRNVVEAIADPLVHMVRNSIDHGIEPAEDRVKIGKKRVGRIDLKAFHQGGNIVIQIVDDGKGLNREKILQKAVKNGIIKEGLEMSDEEVYKLIFHAGLSTAEKVTDISGRGVGMDVVRKNVESLRGRVDIKSEPGRGSTFSIGLPLTLAVIDGQIVSVGKEKFIIPTISLVQSIRPTPDQLSTVCDRGEMIMVRGDLIPMIRLGKLFGIESQYDNPSEALIVIVADGKEHSCLLVDSLLGQQQVVIKNLGDYLGHIRGISGGAIMGDGNVHLILDVPGLIALANNRNASALGVA